MILRRHAFDAEPSKKDTRLRMLKKGKIDLFWLEVETETKTVLSGELKHLLTWMFSYDPKGRPTLEQVLNHPWM
jgi:serine/threonine protein kinase